MRTADRNKKRNFKQLISVFFMFNMHVLYCRFELTLGLELGD